MGDGVLGIPTEEGGYRLGRFQNPVVALLQQEGPEEQDLLLQNEWPDTDRLLRTFAADDISLAVSELEPLALLEKYSATTGALTALRETLREECLDDNNPCEAIPNPGRCSRVRGVRLVAVSEV